MVIRRQPEDFQVEEILDERVALALRDSARPPGAFVVYRLTKRSLTTPAATTAMARALGVKPGHVAHAGLKDKHACTSQHVSVRAPTGRALPDRVEGPGWNAAIVGRLDEELGAEAIAANRFRVVVRALRPRDAREMDERARAIATAEGAGRGALLVPNYFGRQRFGSTRAGRGFVARHLIAGRFEEAVRAMLTRHDRKDTARAKQFARTLAASWGDWGRVLEHAPRDPRRGAVEVLARGGGHREAFAALPYMDQLMAVEAYQSHLWNQVVARCVRDIGGPGAWSIDDDDGLVACEAGKIGPEWRDERVPMLAPGSTARPPWGPACEAVLADEGIGANDLAIPGLRRPRFGEAWRAMFARASEFAVGGPERDEFSPMLAARVLEFELPRGAYATVLLAALGVS